MRVDGAALVVEVSLSVNLASLTIEEVIGKRKKLLSGMLPGLQAELRQQTAAEGVATSEGIDFLTNAFSRKCRAGALSHDEEWFNADEQLETALRCEVL